MSHRTRWGIAMFSFETYDPAADLDFDDAETVAPAAYAHPVAKAAAEDRAAARRSREWRERNRDRATLDAALVDALVTTQKSVSDAARARGVTNLPPEPILLGPVTKLAFKALKAKGWSSEKAHTQLAARLMPDRVPLDPYL